MLDTNYVFRDIDDLKKHIYGFLSKTSYEQLIDVGVDKESIFVLYLCLSWVVFEEYIGVSKCSFFEFDFDMREEREFIPLFQLDKIEQSNCVDDFFVCFDDFFYQNIESLILINDRISADFACDSFLIDWRKIVFFAFDMAELSRMECFSLLIAAMNDSLEVERPAVVASLRLFVGVNLYVKRNSIM